MGGVESRLSEVNCCCRVEQKPCDSSFFRPKPRAVGISLVKMDAWRQHSTLSDLSGCATDRQDSNSSSPPLSPALSARDRETSPTCMAAETKTHTRELHVLETQRKLVEDRILKLSKQMSVVREEQLTYDANVRRGFQQKNQLEQDKRQVKIQNLLAAIGEARENMRACLNDEVDIAEERSRAISSAKPAIFALKRSRPSLPSPKTQTAGQLTTRSNSGTSPRRSVSPQASHRRAVSPQASHRSSSPQALARS